MADLRIGILGSGGWAGQHAQRITRESGARLVAVCGRNRAKAEELAGKHGAEAYDDFSAMLTRARLDALYICLPPYAHTGQAEEAAKAGVHLFLEKPIAIEPGRGRAIVEAIDGAGVVSQVGYHMRFGTASRALKRAIDDGSAGRPTLFTGTWTCNNNHSEWWRDIARSGGQVLEQAIHIYDLACWYLGEPVSVTAAAENLCHREVPGYTVEDTSAAVVRFASGAVASITASNCAIPWEWSGRWSLICERLTAGFQSHNQAEFVKTADQKAERSAVAGDVDPYAEETREFLAAVRARDPKAVCAPARDGLRSLRLCAAALESARQGGAPVALDSDRNLTKKTSKIAKKR
jgi:predicted dehydrogenase